MLKSLVAAGLITVLASVSPTIARDKEDGYFRDRDAIRSNPDELSGAYFIRQKSTGRYVDAYERSRQDFEMVTRPAQDDDTQLWILIPVDEDVYVIQQASSGRYMDAYEKRRYDFQMVTREEQDDATQLWILTCLYDNVYTIEQASSGRFLDAYQEQETDYRLVTRPEQENRTQQWVLEQY